VPPVFPTENKPQYGQETAALRNFSPLYVRFGSLAPDRYATGGRGMSALPRKWTSLRDIALCLLAISELMHRSKEHVRPAQSMC
jgi:hypothetical protein